MEKDNIITIVTFFAIMILGAMFATVLLGWVSIISEWLARGIGIVYLLLTAFLVGYMIRKEFKQK